MDMQQCSYCGAHALPTSQIGFPTNLLWESNSSRISGASNGTTSNTQQNQVVSVLHSALLNPGAPPTHIFPLIMHMRLLHRCLEH